MNEVEQDLDWYEKKYREYQTKYFKTRMCLQIVGFCFLFSLYFTLINCDTMWKMSKDIKKLEDECSVSREDLKGLINHVRTNH